MCALVMCVCVCVCVVCVCCHLRAFVYAYAVCVCVCVCLCGVCLYALMYEKCIQSSWYERVCVLGGVECACAPRAHMAR